MSNRIAGKIIVCDTAATQIGGSMPSTSMPKGPLVILAIKWVGTQNAARDIAQNDDLLIRWGDVNGTVGIECRAQEATPNQQAYSVEFSDSWIADNGLYIDQIDGGELQIFLK